MLVIDAVPSLSILEAPPLAYSTNESVAVAEPVIVNALSSEAALPAAKSAVVAITVSSMSELFVIVSAEAASP